MKSYNKLKNYYKKLAINKVQQAMGLLKLCIILKKIKLKSTINVKLKSKIKMEKFKKLYKLIYINVILRKIIR